MMAAQASAKHQELQQGPPNVRTMSPNEVTRNFLHRIVTLTYVTVILT